jgi:hypothetical protein
MKAAISGRHSGAEGEPSGVFCEPLITSQQVGKILGLHPKVVDRTAAYEKQADPAIEVQLERAGVRLAWVLTRL